MRTLQIKLCGESFTVRGLTSAECEALTAEVADVFAAQIAPFLRRDAGGQTTLSPSFVGSTVTGADAFLDAVLRRAIVEPDTAGRVGEVNFLAKLQAFQAVGVLSPTLPSLDEIVTASLLHLAAPAGAA
jgi:hypothetical protein